MDRGTQVCFFLLLSEALLMIDCARGSFDLNVGGKNGWVTNPSESYSSWAERLRFNVNDSLVFVYDNTVDSVLLVSDADYSSCITATPISRLATGRDSFKLLRSGPFFFISGNTTHCQAGQKLIVVVLAVRSPPSLPAPVLTPPPAAGSTPPAKAPTPARTSPTPAASPASIPSVVSGPTRSPATSPTIPPKPSGAPALTPSSIGAPSSSGGGGATSSQSAPGSGGSEPESAGSPPRPSSSSSATPHWTPRSFPAILAAAALTLFVGVLLQ